MELVHHHLIFQADVGNASLDESSEELLLQFLYDLLAEIDMEELIPAQLKFSHQKAWTGIIGIITSHISFHYWTVEKYVQLDIYSCKEFDKERAIQFISEFWQASNVRALFIDRNTGESFKVEELS